MSDRPLTDQQGVSASLKQSSLNQSVSLEPEDNEERPWSASKIAENIVGRIARYKWLPKSGKIKPTDAPKELEKASSSAEVQQDGGGVEYTSEHLEKALIELKFSTSKVETKPKAPNPVAETITEIKTESVETHMSLINLSGTAMSTDVSYPVNLKQSHQTAEIKPIVENMSTQSSSDIIQFNAHTTTDDLKAAVTPEMLSKALLNVTAHAPDGLQGSKSNTDTDQHSKKSKVPVLKPDHLSCPSSSVNLNKVGKVNQKLSGSKIPLRLTGSSTSDRERVLSKTSLNFNRIPLPPQNVSRTNIEIDRAALSDIVFRPRANLSNVGEDSSVMNVIQLNSFEENKMLSKLATQPRQAFGMSQNENKENTVLAELQTDEIPPCGTNNREAKLSSESDTKCKFEKEAYNNELVASCIETDHADSTTTEIGIKQDVDKIKSTETLEDDDEYEDYDDEEELENDKIAEMPCLVQRTSIRCSVQKDLSRESKTCLMGPPQSLPCNTKDMPGCSETQESEESDTSRPISENDVIVHEQISSTENNKTICVKTKISTEHVQKKPGQSNSVAPIDLEEIKNLSPEDIAFEVNVFNMIQSQKINNILRMAMPYNSILLPIFVSSPTAIMHALDYEVRSTMEIKRKASVYYSELKKKMKDASKPVEANVKKSTDKIVSSSSRTGVPIWKPVSVTNELREPSKPKPNKARSATETTTRKSAIRPSYIYYGAIIGPQIMAKHKTLWIAPPYYYGTNKPVLAK